MNIKMSEELFCAIKLDNLIDFSRILKQNQCENLCFGRFPILSVCYLFNSKKIIKKYEKTLLKVQKYQKTIEIFEIYTKFKQKATRCLRLYLDTESVVSPLEMLAILHQDGLVKRRFNFAFRTDKCSKNLIAIYKTIYGQDVEILPNKIKIGAKKLSYSDSKSLKFGLVVSLAFMLIVFSCFALVSLTVGDGTINAVKISTASQFFSAIRGGGKYDLENDLTLKNVNFGNFSGVLNGNNHTITIEFGEIHQMVENNNGTIKNLNIECLLDDETEISSSTSLLCKNNNGTLENVSIVFSANLGFSKTSGDDIYFSLLAVENNGYIKDCSVSLNIVATENGNGNAYVSGIAGVNNGTISACEVLAGSQFEATDVDVCGIVAKNSKDANISSCNNSATIKQNSIKEGWSPNVSGIALNNYGAITNCYNFATLEVTSSYDNESNSAAAYIGGICAINNGRITHCLNKGDLTATTKYVEVYCGGICAYSSSYNDGVDVVSSYIQTSGVDCNINATTEGENTHAFVGGISGFCYGGVESCYSLATFSEAYNESKYHTGTFVGAVYFNGFYVYITSQNNYVLSADNVEYQLGSLVNNGIYGGNNLSSGVVVTGEDQIKNSEVFWNEQTNA